MIGLIIIATFIIAMWNLAVYNELYCPPDSKRRIYLDAFFKIRR